MRRRLMVAGGALVVTSVGLSSAHPWGDLRHVPRGAAILSGSAVPPEVQLALEKKCADCHSNQTYWPVYSLLAPGSWLMERDVHTGRLAMNLSRWNEMNVEDRISTLTRIGAEVRSGEMPPAPYSFMHPANRLTEQEQKAIATWAKDERKKIRAMSDKQKGKNQ